MEAGYNLSARNFSPLNVLTMVLHLHKNKDEKELIKWQVFTPLAPSITCRPTVTTPDLSHTSAPHPIQDYINEKAKHFISRTVQTLF